MQHVTNNKRVSRTRLASVAWLKAVDLQAEGVRDRWLHECLTWADVSAGRGCSSFAIIRLVLFTVLTLTSSRAAISSAVSLRSHNISWTRRFVSRVSSGFRPCQHQCHMSALMQRHATTEDSCGVTPTMSRPDCNVTVVRLLQCCEFCTVAISLAYLRLLQLHLLAPHWICSQPVLSQHMTLIKFLELCNFFGTHARGVSCEGRIWSVKESCCRRTV